MVGKSQWAEFKFWLYYSLTACVTWTSHLTSVSLSLLTCKIGHNDATPSWGRTKGSLQEALRTEDGTG